VSIIDKVGSAGQRVNWESRKFGVELAAITNIQDPEKLGRVKCKLLTDDKNVGETDWCFVMTPFGGKEYGLFLHPNVDDIVVIAYAGGDVHRPYVLGSLWNKETKSPYAVNEGKNELFALKTPAKTEISLSDVKEKQKLTITMPSGTVLELDDENKRIEIRDKEKKNKLTMALDKDEVEVAAGKKLTLSAGETQIVLESSGAVTVKSKTKVDISTGTLSVNANSKAEIKSNAEAVVQSTGQLTLKSSGVTTLKGSMVKIN